MVVRVLGIAGSLRVGSYNRALLRAAVSLVPEGMTIETAEIDLIPLYNGDVEASGVPLPVQDLKQRIARADALLFATPEYNHSVPGVLKNAIDWVSRPPDPPLGGKPTAIMGASPGPFGTLRAQLHLRQIGVTTDMLILNKPQVHVSKAREKFDSLGDLTDEPTRKAVGELLFALKAWTLRLTGGAARG